MADFDCVSHTLYIARYLGSLGDQMHCAILVSNLSGASCPFASENGSRVEWHLWQLCCAAGAADALHLVGIPPTGFDPGPLR